MIIKYLTKSSFQLAPNPAQTSFSLAFSEKTIGRRWQISTVQGKTLQSGKIGQTKTDIDISILPDGAYLFTILKHKNIERQLFIKAN